MTTRENESSAKTQSWHAENPALLRAAKKIIRLYDLKHGSLMVVKAESIAQVIAQELNHGSD
jgi:hypothetical protein